MRSSCPSSTSYPAVDSRHLTRQHARSLRLHVTAFSAQPGRKRHHQGSDTASATYERVLRYPDGLERRIRYPVVHEEDIEDSSCFDDLESLRGSAWDVPGLWPQVPTSRRSRRKSTSGALQEKASASSTETQHQEGRKDKTRELPSSPMELLNYLSSDSFREAERQLQERIRNSYKILYESPWIQSRPVYVLASVQADGSAATYTLRTRCARQDMEDEVSKVLKRKRPDGGSVISVSEMRDGIVTFEDESSAERFKCLLEADGFEVVVARCDSHQLFLSVQEVKGVVVLLPQSAELLLPGQLMASLRKQESLEDGPAP